MIKAFPDDIRTHMLVAVNDKLCDYLATRNYDTYDTGNTSICAVNLKYIIGNKPEFADDYVELSLLYDMYKVDYLTIYRAGDSDDDFKGWGCA